MKRLRGDTETAKGELGRRESPSTQHHLQKRDARVPRGKHGLGARSGTREVQRVFRSANEFLGGLMDPRPRIGLGPFREGARECQTLGFWGCTGLLTRNSAPYSSIKRDTSALRLSGPSARERGAWTPPSRTGEVCPGCAARVGVTSRYNFCFFFAGRVGRWWRGASPEHVGPCSKPGRPQALT